MKRNYVKSERLLNLLISFVCCLLFLTSCAKQPAKVSHRNIVSEKIINYLTKEAEPVKGFGKIMLNTGKKEYVSEFVVFMNGSRIDLQLMDFIGNILWSLSAEGENYTIVENDKVYKGAGDRFLKKHLGFPFTNNELKSVIAGRVLVLKGEEVYSENGSIFAGKNEIFMENQKITGWKNKLYEVKFADFRKIKKTKRPFEIDVLSLKNKGCLKIKYEKISN